jgi:hypothetical protein
MGRNTLIFLSLKEPGMGSQSALAPADKCENFARVSWQGVVKCSNVAGVGRNKRCQPIVKKLTSVM